MNMDDYEINQVPIRTITKKAGIAFGHARRGGPSEEYPRYTREHKETSEGGRPPGGREESGVS